jgi:dynein heavy chain 1
VADFDADLRGIMKRAGCKGEKICFIFDESNVLGPAFLERMNALLASGEVPGLFEGDEYISLLNMAREHILKEIKGVETEEEIYKAFIKGVQRNLHVVFTMNPLSPDFSNRAASSPALYNRCVIDWFGDWSREGLFQVAKKLTENADLRKENFKKQDMSKEEMHTLIVDSITSYHIVIKELNEKLSKNAKKFNYITPRDFLDFIKHFINLQKEKNDELNEQKTHINKGLQKIIQTEKTVNELKQSLAIKGKELDKKQEEAKIKFQKIMEDQEKASQNKQKAEAKQVQIEETKKEIDERTKKVNDELSTVVPKMEAAKQAIGNIDKKKVAALKALKTVKDYLKVPLKLAAIIYMKFAKKKMVEKMEWDEIKNCIIKEDFISTIKNVKAEELGAKLTSFIQKEINNPDNEWDLDKIRKGFLEAGLLAEWIEATVACANINNQMEPLKKEIAGLNAEKDKVVNEFNEIAKEKEMLEKSIQQLKINYEESIVESNNIKKEIEQVQNKVERSEKLLLNLSSEKERWSQQMNEFKNNINNLLGDTYLSSSFLAYIGFYDAFYRKYLKDKSRQIVIQNEIISSTDLDEVEWLTKANDKAIWQNCKLPNDNICLENATILQRFNRYPLIIDPAGQATEFIKTFNAKKLSITTFTDSNFLKTLENALRFGIPILVQDVEKIDPIMNSLLNKEIHKQSGRNLIRIGDKEIDFSMSFNMFMVTRDSSCHFTPDLCSRVTFLNFTITQSSLQNQILDIVLKNERPEVNQKKEELIKAQREYKVQLRQLEEDLLTALNSEGNLLENNEVMTRLEDIKKKSQEISIEVSKSEDIMKELESTMNEYAPLANKASKIFFALDSLEVIHYLYRYSLSFFMDILNFVINCKEMQEIPKNMYSNRQIKIIQLLFKEIYHRVGYSLLNKDKAILAMRLSQISLGDKFKNEINLLLKINSNIMNDASDISSDILGGKLTLNQKKQLSELNKSEPFTGIVSEITSNSESWNNFYNDPYAENSIPTDFLNKHREQISNEKDQKIFDSITKSILLLVFRPDRMMNCIQTFLKDVFNEELVNIPELDLVKVIKEETNCKMPILFCSAPGFDASTKIESLARQLSKKCLSIAIGSSEGFDLVDKNWASKIQSGEWLVLKNVHLAPTWLNEIEKRLYANEPNPNFRLFLTMEFNPKIPANVLRISRKFVFELPSGIKHSLIRSYANVLTPAKSEKNPHERCRLHFLLAWFHAVIGERLRYVPIGWSKFYEFNESDQKCALDAIDEWINIHAKDSTNIAPKQIPWDAIRTIIHQSMYGGKIDNEYDMKILESLVNLYFNEKAYDFNYPLFKTSSENQSNVLKIPDKTSNSGFIEWINALPNVESPEWSGLPNNAEKLVRETASNRFITEMNKIQGVEDEELGSEDTAGKKTQASWLISVQEKSNKLLKALPLQVKPLVGNKQSNNDPIFRFLLREVAVASKLLNKVRDDLDKLILMSKGESKSTNELRDIAKNIFNDSVPKVWQIYSTLELNVTEWILDLKNRVNQLNKITQAKDYGRSDLWLGGLIFPEAYLTATRQSVAQELKVSLDELMLSVELVKNITEVDNTCFVLKGLCIEGAEWSYSENKLIMTDSLFSQLPPFLLRWSVRKNANMDNLFPIPVYLNTMRKNLLFSVFIKNESVLTDSDWYQRGIALISWNKTYEYERDNK